MSLKPCRCKVVVIFNKITIDSLSMCGFTTYFISDEEVHNLKRLKLSISTFKNTTVVQVLAGPQSNEFVVKNSKKSIFVRRYRHSGRKMAAS
jgi:hypothetical protein